MTQGKLIVLGWIGVLFLLIAANPGIQNNAAFLFATTAIALTVICSIWLNWNRSP